ncbi:hypothetical protein GCM10008090_30790 [Arenicella chitinivorans]|uniref:Prolyl 3,4-dihydroxylase TPA1/OFD1 N-terminal domain-containing protein n=1 Tax=Arenicella chitinivorans TaxID=1329800 RepID=A0A918VRL3_9GAMM|nr:2OG-Fe(II) oxygenase [Arenicella chitinivorans]GHA18954.1 hypothetical protein GCM10008090_30790 [Arenicella chitinivorans]
MSLFNLENNDLVAHPFRHSTGIGVLPNNLVRDVLIWCREYPNWKHKTLPDFLSLYSNRPAQDEIPKSISWLFSDEAFFSALRHVQKVYDVELSSQIDIQFQKMSENDYVKIHSDHHSKKKQTHRFLIHFNEGWTEENGGYFMVFGDDNGTPNLSDNRTYLPLSNSVFTFEISEKSHHAVSKVLKGDRYTLMYSFRAKR